MCKSTCSLVAKMRLLNESNRKFSLNKLPDKPVTLRVEGNLLVDPSRDPVDESAGAIKPAELGADDEDPDELLAKR